MLADPTRLRLAVLLAMRGETCVCMLAGALGEPDFKISRHLGIMRAAGMVEARREGQWMYYRLAQPRLRLEKCLHECFRDCLADHETLKADIERLEMATCAEAQKLRILFLCTGNACRSQMAEGWARHLKADVIEPFSAGIEKHGLDPLAVKAMAEAGVDISRHDSKVVADLPTMDFDCVVTVCDHAHESCPHFPGKAKIVHAGFDDPPRLAACTKSEEEALAHYRRVRDEMREFVEKLPDCLRTLPR